MRQKHIHIGQNQRTRQMNTSLAEGSMDAIKEKLIVRHTAICNRQLNAVAGGHLTFVGDRIIGSVSDKYKQQQ